MDFQVTSTFAYPSAYPLNPTTSPLPYPKSWTSKPPQTLLAPTPPPYPLPLCHTPNHRCPSDLSLCLPPCLTPTPCPHDTTNHGCESHLRLCLPLCLLPTPYPLPAVIPKIMDVQATSAYASTYAYPTPLTQPPSPAIHQLMDVQPTSTYSYPSSYHLPPTP